MSRYWNSEYYNSLEFYYWEPQHLGRVKKPDNPFKNATEMLKSLKRLEVSLNHQLNLFFRLAPNKLVEGLFEHVLDEPFRDTFEFIGRESWSRFKLGAVIQPDIFFQGKSTVVCIEMKLGAKSSLDQVIKYAYLNVMEQEQSQTPKKHYLIFLGKSSFAQLWPQKFQDFGALQNALSEYEIPPTLNGVDISAYHEQMRRMVEVLSFGFLNYQHLADYLHAQQATIETDSEYAEIYAKLLAGMIDELQIRGLAA